MAGRYLRKKREGMRDPTMTHVDDPCVFQVGDYVRDHEGWNRITAIRDNVFDNPDIRFADLEWCLEPPNGARIHDFRPLDAENFYHTGWVVESDVPRPVSEVMTLEEAGRAYQEALRKGR